MFLLWKTGPGLCPFKDTQGFVEVWSKRVFQGIWRVVMGHSEITHLK